MALPVLTRASNKHIDFGRRSKAIRSLSKLSATYTMTGGLGRTMIGGKWVAQAGGSGLSNIRQFQALGGAGALIEESRTNLCLYSSEDNAAWVSTGSAPTRATATSVIDGKSAIKLTRTGAGSGIYQAIGTFSGGTETAYMIVEQGDATTCSMSIYDNTGAATVATIQLTFATGAVAVTAGAASAYGAKQGWTTGPNGGKVFYLYASYSATGGNVRRLYFYPAPSGTAYTYLHHAQLCNTSDVTSPIVTTSASASRGAEQIYFSAPGWYGSQISSAESMEFLADAATGANQLIWVASDGTANNVIGTYMQPGGQYTAFKIVAASPDPAGSGVDIIAAIQAKACGSIKATEVMASANSSTPVTSSFTASMPAGINIFSIGSSAGSTCLNGSLKSLRWLPYYLTAAQCEALSS